MINIKNTDQFIVTIDGHLDEAWVDQMYNQERRQALRKAAQEAINATLAHSLSFGRRAGMAVLNGLDELIQASNSTPAADHGKS